MFNFPLAPEQASTFAFEYDLIFWVLTILTIVFTLLVSVLVIFFAIRYRHGSKVDRSRPVYENLPMELTWTIIPMILGLIMFFFGANLFVKMRTPPADATEIFVIGKQWMWHVQHPNGVRENNTLHVPVGKPIKLTMISQDVLHAMYIPEFRAQFHVVPGRYTQMWFEPTKKGVYHIFCNQYCGGQHSEMGGYVYVMDPKDYAAWLANGGNEAKPQTMVQKGAQIYNTLACGNCHGEVDNERGPSLFGLMGKQRTFEDGGRLMADEAYIREAILDPYEHINAGYSNTMPAYNGQISEENMLYLIAYIKSLGAATGGAVAGGEAFKGLQESGNNARQTQMNAGALASEKTPKPDVMMPRDGNLAVGAIAAEGNDKGSTHNQ